ncbi:MAG: hypothetical protein Q7S33_02295 [Nanoarchaeota archaeon]|nr:hypothetical protein [Nanoarchaeota archaeon]
MTYNSLFDKILKGDPSFRKDLVQQQYFGSLENVLSEIEENLISSKPYNINLALHPPRIIRAVIDYKIENPFQKEPEILLREAIQLGLDVYKGNSNVIEEIKQLKENIEKNNDELLKKTLEQPIDKLSWDATNPKLSKRTADELIKETKGQEILYIALAHGGIAAGMDSFLRYCDKTNNYDSSFYVSRFSMQKLKDLKPQLTNTEIEYLQKLAIRKRVVIFDEDSYSGTTLDEANYFFKTEVFPNKTIINAVNSDARINNIKFL